MSKNKNGFAALESLLILVIVAIIGGTGYYVWHSKAQTDKNLNNAASANFTETVKKKTSANGSAAISSQASVDEQASTAKSADGKVQVTLPDGWKVSDRIDGGQKCGFVDPGAGGTCISDISFQDGTGKLDSYVKIFKSDMSPGQWYDSVFGSCNNDASITINGEPGYQCEPDPSTSSIEYVIANSTYVAYFYGAASSASETALARSVKFL